MKLSRSWGLVLLVVPPLAPAFRAQAGAAQRLASLEQRLAEERKQWLEFQRHATSEAERAELAGAFPREDFVPAFEAVAAEAAGTELAARAWLGAFRVASLLGERELYARALGHLVEEHAASPAIAPLTLELVYGAPSWSARPAAEALRAILAQNPSKDVQGAALVELALLVGLAESFGAEGRAEAETLLARIERDYPTSDFLGMTGREFAAGARHEITQLCVGAVAPDFEAVDQDGTRFQLSDYRGQVVLLDFWGFV